MNNALWSPRGAQARERTHSAGYTDNNFMSHFEGHFEGAKTFLTPEIVPSAARDNLGVKKKSRLPQHVPRNGS